EVDPNNSPTGGGSPSGSGVVDRFAVGLEAYKAEKAAVKDRATCFVVCRIRRGNAMPSGQEKDSENAAMQEEKSDRALAAWLFAQKQGSEGAADPSGETIMDLDVHELWGTSATSSALTNAMTSTGTSGQKVLEKQRLLFSFTGVPYSTRKVLVERLSDTSFDSAGVYGKVLEALTGIDGYGASEFLKPRNFAEVSNL
ncbi:unnamed protein product, partial [Amoebophrya sp. A25]